MNFIKYFTRVYACYVCLNNKGCSYQNILHWASLFTIINYNYSVSWCNYLYKKFYLTWNAHKNWGKRFTWWNGLGTILSRTFHQCDFCGAKLEKNKFSWSLRWAYRTLGYIYATAAMFFPKNVIIGPRILFFVRKLFHNQTCCTSITSVSFVSYMLS